jgi:multicomponent Na+:H+ antiporter subunit B
VGGLVAGSAFVLYALAAGVAQARELLKIEPHTLLGVGLACAVGAGLIGLAAGVNFMKSLWLKIPLPGLGTLKLGTTLLFDIGVMLVVVGTVLLMVFSVEDRLPGLVED